MGRTVARDIAASGDDPQEAAITGQTYRDQFEGNFEQNQADLSDQLLIDVAVSGASKPQPARERGQADLQSAEKKLKTKPDDPDARYLRAMAYFRLGENQKALDDLQFVIGKNPEAVSAKQYRVIALARLGKKQDARSELEKFQKGDAPEHSKLYLAAVVAAELGEGADKAFETLEAAIGKQPQDADLRYDAARAFSLASRTGGGRRPSGARVAGNSTPPHTTHHPPPSNRDVSNCSGRRSRTTMPISPRWMRTPTSTRSGTTRRSPRS